MPRNGSGIYQRVTGTEAISGEVISSADYEAQMNDFATDLNAPRPVSAGGTGASSLAAFRTAAGLVVGEDVQAYNVKLQSLSDTEIAADKGIYATSEDAFATFDLGSLSREFLANTTAAGYRSTIGIELSTQAEAEAGADAAKYMTPLRTKQAIDALKDVSSGVAETAALAVGSHCLMRTLAGGPYQPGDTVSGGNLSPCDVEGSPRLSGGAVSTASGQWRCMGVTRDAGSVSTGPGQSRSTLFLRIS